MDSSVGICIFGESQGWYTWRLYNEDGKKRGPREVAQNVHFSTRSIFSEWIANYK